MSLVPLLFSDWWEDLEYPHRVFDQNFGLGVHPDQLTHPNILERFALQQPSRRLRPGHMMYYNRPWGELLRSREDGGISTVKADKDKFQVMLDVQQFKPEEINVKVVDKSVVVEAKHEEKQDEHGWISRQFVRKYMIPEQCDIDQVSSSLSSDGMLSITAPRKDKPKSQIERTIKIQHTGKPAIQEKAQEKTQEKTQEKKK
ncbi:PREDICTED: protein lethal(2)essential for life [Trachymyrmex cornetzi]|uniref:Protein lethal(2)essential for life n=1 Tax=Trachymyrmex cornetzi TaxID=471704 RepID=A0A195E0U0_9HYME|nr:PREDICTED: protein lethal(2)essential for life [Trachymyrmex cornetzi]KYN18547.1 Protein lethal(2)essential for life [Trachymyrmex cornetzi]